MNELSSNDIYGQGQEDLRQQINGNGFIETVDNNENSWDNNDIPIHCLRPTTINLLSTMLNPTKIIPTESGLARDWRGLAELIGLTSESITFLQSRSDPTSEILKMWSSNSSSSSTSTIIKSKSIAELKTFLCVIDRFDIVDDVQQCLEKDVAFYKTRRFNHSLSDSQTRTVPELDMAADAELLTYDDQLIGNGKSARYDAFLLYSDDDSSFAMEIVDKMEKEYNLKMCLKDRDIMPGIMFEHEVIGKLIEERCNRLLIIFSPSFLQSPANNFLVSYTQALALETRQRKIIPCIYKQCTLPPSVRYSFCLDYNRSSKLWNFWERLGQSLSTIPSSSSSTSQLLVTNESSKLNRSVDLPLPSLRSSKSGTSLPNDVSWWEPSKDSEKKNLSTSVPYRSDFDYLRESSSNFDDNISIQSEDPLLLTNNGKSPDKVKSKKWIKKILRPMKKKPKDKDGHHAPSSVAVLES